MIQKARAVWQGRLFFWGITLHQTDNQIPTFRNNRLETSDRGVNYLLTQRNIPE